MIVFDMVIFFYRICYIYIYIYKVGVVVVAGGLQWLIVVVVAFFFSSVVVSFERERKRD